MDALLEKELQEEENTWRNAAFLLKDSKEFLVSAYKVMKSQGWEALAPCVKVLRNGRIRLVYFTEERKKLSELKGHLSRKTCLRFLHQIFTVIREVEENGFLTTGCLLLSDDHIYVDVKTSTVMLIYVPVLDWQESARQNELAFRRRLSGELLNEPAFQVPELYRFSEDLQDEKKTASDLLLQLDHMLMTEKDPAEGQSGKDSGSLINDTEVFQANLRLKCLRPGLDLHFTLQSGEMILGKLRNEGMTVIDDPTVSRRHCRIFESGGTYFVEDLGSTNGTFINRNRIPVGSPVGLKNEDRLHIAKVPFMVEC